MRITLLLMFVASFAFGQEVTIYQNGKVTTTKVNASSANSFYAKEGTFKFVEIDSIKTDAQDLMKKFIDFKTQTPSTIHKASPVITKNENPDLDQLYKGIDEFRKQRDVGKGMQLVGILSVGASIFISQKTQNKDLVQGLSAGGAGLAAIGFLVDLSASKHLKFKF